MTDPQRPPATAADLSLAMLKKALIQASSRPVTTDNLPVAPVRSNGALTTPSTLASSPTDDKPPRTNFGFTHAPLKRFAADVQPPDTGGSEFDKKPTPVRNTQALRSELRALQEGLVQLKQAIATRRVRAFANQRTQQHEQHHVESTSQQSNDDRVPYSAPVQPAFVFEDDILSQTESAAPSAAWQTHVLGALQAMTTRLQRLEESRLPPTQTVPEETKSADQFAVEALLQAEVTEERFRRLRLEAVVRAMALRLGIDTDNFDPLGSRAVQQAAEAAFDPGMILSMSPAELRAMVQSLSIRTKEALRLQTIAKCKVVQLNSALRTVSDLAARIVELEELLNQTRLQGSEASSKADTIQDLSLRVRSQLQTIKALKHEAAILRNNMSDAHFDLKRLTDDFISSAIQGRPPSRVQSIGPKGAQRKPTLGRSEMAGTPSDTPSPSGTFSRMHHAGPSSVNLGSQEQPVGVSDPDANQMLNATPVSAAGDYIPVPDDPIDIAVANFVNTRLNYVTFVRLRPAYYMFGSLTLRVGLSATTKTPLAYYEGRKYSLRKFVSLFEEGEYAKQRQRRPLSLRQSRLPTEEHHKSMNRLGRASPLASPGQPSPTRMKLRTSMSEGPGDRDRPRSLLPPFPSNGTLRNVATLAADPSDSLGMSLGHWRPRLRQTNRTMHSPMVPNLRQAAESPQLRLK